MTQATPDFEETAVEDHGSDLDLEVENDENLDVDTPSDDDEVETVVEGDTTSAAKPAKATRPKAPEGYVKPVEFAKILSEHLNKAVPPQVVYSYVKNNSGGDAKHPFPVHEVDGYAWYIKPEEGLKWWDEKNTRVATSKATQAAKAAAKAEKATAPAAAETSAEPVVEAE